MGKKQDEILSNPEFDALKGVDGLDPDKLMEAVTGEPQGTPPAGDTPPADTGTKPADTGTKPVDAGTPSAEPKKEDQQAPAPQDDILKEIFGDRFKTVDEARQANISGMIDEVESLRQAKTDLEEQLSRKPKTNFANDEVALFNEFVKETGVHSYGVFRKINDAELTNMDPMEALITKHILDHPHLASKEPQVRKHFERKYNVDPEQVEEETLELNKMEMETDGISARKALQELKGKLKVPEPTTEVDTPKELTPEEKSNLQTGWNNVGKNVSTALGKLKIPIKNGKEPLLDYEISESEQKEIQDFVANYAVENHMELNETNVRTISNMVYNQLMINKLPEIVHSVFERARSLTEEEVHAIYENPSPARNTDQPPTEPEGTKTDADKLQDEIFNAEMEEYNK